MSASLPDPYLLALLRAARGAAPAPALALPLTGLGALLAGLPPVPTPAPAAPPKRQWIAVTERFQRFHTNLLLTPSQREDGLTKARGVVRCLNAHCYESDSESDHA